MKSGSHTLRQAAIATALIALTAPGLVADAQTTLGAYEVTASSLNVRYGASTRNGAFARIGRGQSYPAIQRSGEWLLLQIGSKRGWSHGGYLRAVNHGVYEVTASSLNVRTGPSTRYRALGRLSRGNPVAVRASSGSWKKISFNGRDAWVHGGYLRSVGSSSGSSSDTTRPRPTPTPPPTTSRPRSRAGFIQLASSGPGWAAYGAAYKRWGRPTLVYGIERVARRQARRSRTRMGVGNISLENGGRMPPHSSHQRGVDVDVRPMRSDGREAGVTIHQSAYSRSRTQALVSDFRRELSIRIILFNDSGVSGVRYWSGHDNHFHVSMNR